jgi:hypothetical protein
MLALNTIPTQESADIMSRQSYERTRVANYSCPDLKSIAERAMLGRGFLTQVFRRR